MNDQIVNPEAVLDPQGSQKEFLVAITTGVKGEVAWKRVIGEEITVPGLEEFRLFIQRLAPDEDGFLIVEVTTGRILFGLEDVTQEEMFSYINKFIGAHGGAFNLRFAMASYAPAPYVPDGEFKVKEPI
jgi:hypothetical protein